jgi:hypothetical protein
MSSYRQIIEDLQEVAIELSSAASDKKRILVGPMKSFGWGWFVCVALCGKSGLSEDYLIVLPLYEGKPELTAVFPMKRPEARTNLQNIYSSDPAKNIYGAFLGYLSKQFQFVDTCPDRAPLQGGA